MSDTFGWSWKVLLDHIVNIYIVFNGLEKLFKTIQIACLIRKLMQIHNVFLLTPASGTHLTYYCSTEANNTMV